MILAISFMVIVLLALLLFYVGTGKDKRVLYFFLVWATITGTLSGVGFFSVTAALPPRIAWVMIPAVLYVIWFYRNLTTDKIQIDTLLAIHVLRIGVELVLLGLYRQGRVPVLMTFEGWNFDILSGVTAVLLLLYRLFTGQGINHTVFLVWNILGLVFVAIIVSIATLSAPSPLQQLAFEQPNRAVLDFPYTLLPAVIVPVVVLSHLLSLKWLRQQR